MVLGPSGVLRAIGDSDCESLGGGAFAQPVNALTSFSYVVIGLLVAVVAVRRGRDVTASLVYASCLAAVGVGSVLFHGPQPDGSREMHDVPILWTVLFIVVHDALLLVGRPASWQRVFVAAMAVVTPLAIIWPDLGLAITGAGVTTLAVLEILIFRAGRRSVTTRRQVRAYVVIIVVAALASASWLLGRTSSPACDPESVFQFHGLWHVISAAVFGLWWWLAIWLTGSPVELERTGTVEHAATVRDER